MKPDERNEWSDHCLQEILQAVGSDAELKDALVFKGARILNLHLGTHRQSLDIDSSLDVGFHDSMPDRDAQADWFREKLGQAVRSHFEGQDPVRYVLDGISVRKNPKGPPHPRGWNGLVAEMNISDGLLRNVRNLPSLELEIAAPELLGPGAVCELEIDGFSLHAYSLHRIAGEKLRAFLTSLPAYRRKMSSRERIHRAKDLHDIVRILRSEPITARPFWEQAAGEFMLACESRYVDCGGLATFQEDWDATRVTYLDDPSLARIPWEEVGEALTAVVGFIGDLGIFPLIHPLPDTSPNETP